MIFEGMTAENSFLIKRKTTILFISVPVLFFLLLTVFISFSHATVSILMDFESAETDPEKKYVMPGEKFTLSFNLVDAAQEMIGGIVIDLDFDDEFLSVSPNTDVQISSDIQDKKTLYKNLITDGRLRVLLIGFNDITIPNGSNLFTVMFKVIKKPVLLPGTIIYSHASSSTIGGQRVATIANCLFIPIVETSALLSEISGKVIDSQTGQGIPGVKVGIISEIKPDIFYQTLTDIFGGYGISNVIEGTYTLLALKGGYNAFTEKNFVFAQGNPLNKNISLNAGVIDFDFVYPATSDGGPFLTSLSAITLYGTSPVDAQSILIKGEYLAGYSPGDLFWTNRIALNIGDNLITALAYDAAGSILNSASIIINRTSESNFKINIPTGLETYESSQSSVSVGGLTTSDTVYIYLNGAQISDYQAGDTTWGSLVNNQVGVNYLNFTAKRLDGSLVGTDSITIRYNPSAPAEQLIITSPTLGDYYKTGQSTVSIGGQTFTNTHSLTMNDAPLSGYTAGSASWLVTGITLSAGANNYFTFKAYDLNSALLGEASITIEYEAGYINEEDFTIKIPTENDTYTAESQTITIGGDTPAGTAVIRFNGVPISGYQPGNTSWSTGFTLESGQNHIIAVAYDAQGLEIGADSITITFILSFGEMRITQPVNAPEYQTKKKTIHLGGQTSQDTCEIMVNEDLLADTDYQAGNSTWSYDTSISLGTYSFVFTAYDIDKEIIGRDEIVVTNPGVLQITKPSATEDYTTEGGELLMVGTISWLPDDPVTNTIEINGQALAGYKEGAPLWSCETNLSYGENDFYVLAYEASSTTPIGVDFIKIIYREKEVLSDRPIFQIRNPAADQVIFQESIIIVEGDSPSITQKIYRNNTEISFTPYGTFWSDSIELMIGENYLEYKAVDESGQSAGRDELLVIYNGVMRIIEPVSETIFYYTEEDEVTITLRITSPGTGLSVNDRPMAGYAGQSTISYSAGIQDGDNVFVFKLINSEGTRIGYSKVNIMKQEINKSSVGAGFCFIDFL